MGNREKAPLLRKVIEKRKAMPSAIGCPQSLQELVCDPSGDGGYLQVYNAQTTCRLASPLSPVDRAPSKLSSKLSLSVGLVCSGKEHLSAIFSLAEVQLETYIYVLQLLMSCCLTLSRACPDNIVKRQ